MNVWRRWFVSWLVVAVRVVFLLGMAQGRPTVDVNGNGMSDIWEWIYGAVGLDPAGDPYGADSPTRSKPSPP